MYTDPCTKTILFKVSYSSRALIESLTVTQAFIKQDYKSVIINT